MNHESYPKKIWGWLTDNKVLVVATIVYFLIRLPYLDQLNLLHDERDISLSGYSIAKTAQDLSGHFLPLRIDNIAPETPFVSIYFSALWWLFFSYKTVFLSRLPFVIFSSFLIPIIYSLVRTMGKDKYIAATTAIITCFSPWIFHISRLGFEINLALPLVLLAITFQLKGKRVISYFFYFVSFYTYQGYRILIPFAILFVSLFTPTHKSKKNILKTLAMHLLLILALFGSIQVIDKDITTKRFNQVVFLNRNYFDNQIIFDRNTSLAPEKVRAFFDNKITAPINYVLSGFIKGQDITYLFKDGDYSAINGSISGGQFLFPLIIFYYLGFFALGKKTDRNSLFFIGLIPLGMLPALASLNGVSFGIRGILSSVGYSYVIAQGALYTADYAKKIKSMPVRAAGLVVFALLMAISLSFFVYSYFFRRPILLGEMFNENERKVSLYMVQNVNGKPMVAASNDPKNLSRSYQFFQNGKTAIMPKFIDCKEYRQTEFPDTIRIISSDCIGGKLGDKIPSKTIGYSDYSGKTAFYIFE